MTTNDLHREVQAWRNRALLAESQLAIVTSSTSRTRPHNLPLTDAASNPSQPLPTITAEQE